jgi:hypothetical protein
MDIEHLSAKAFARCGIRLEPNDPAFVLVALNQIVLQETTSEVSANLDAKMAAFSESMREIERRTGNALAQQVEASAVEMRQVIQNDVKEANWRARELVLQMNRSNARPALVRWTVIGALAAVLMFVCGICFGWYFPLA